MITTNRGHYLKRTKRHAKPVHLIVMQALPGVNTTKTPDRHIRRLAHVVARRYKYVSSSDTHMPRLVSEISTDDHIVFWEWIQAQLQNERTTWIYAYDLGQHLQLLKYNRWAVDPDITQTLIVDSGPPTYVKGKYGTARYVLADIKDIMPWQQHRIFALAGINEPEYDATGYHEDSMERYARELVYAWHAVLHRWRNVVIHHSLGSWKVTIGQQAWAAYVRDVLPHTMLTTPDPQALQLARDAYHGGRIQAFTVGQRIGQFVQLDYNALYPSIMANNVLPTRHCGNGESMQISDLYHMLNDYCIIARCKVRLREPCLPIRSDTSVIYPTGVYITTLSTPEIAYMLDSDNINELIEIYEWAAYVPGSVAMRLMQDLWAIRQQYVRTGTSLEAHLIKRLMNSLYGKFGQQQRKWVLDETSLGCMDAKRWVERCPDTNLVHQYRATHAGVQKLLCGGETASSMPEIAAHITAHGRMILWQLIKYVGYENVHYCDTDGLICTDNESIDRLQTEPDALGSLRIVGRHNQLTIAGKKAYILGDKRTEAGRKPDAEDQGHYYHQWHASKWNRDSDPDDGSVVSNRITRVSNLNAMR